MSNFQCIKISLNAINLSKRLLSAWKIYTKKPAQHLQQLARLNSLHASQFSNKTGPWLKNAVRICLQIPSKINENPKNK